MTPGPLRTAAVGILLAAIAAPWSAPAEAQTQVPPATTTTAPAGSAAKGKALYERIGCYQCHSEQGQGGTQGPRLGPRPIPFQAFLRYLRTPKRRDAAVQSEGDVGSGCCRRVRVPAGSAASPTAQ